GKACLLHDIGMFSIDNKILNKKEKLTEKELITIRNHTKEGAEILKKEEEVVRLCALHHHERVDGEGYPNKIRGEELPEMTEEENMTDSTAMQTDSAAMTETQPVTK
ncbi:MAG TPA: HD domain-containing phosphohydrolase, partial [Bacteroidales bacterium]|nr:HD domain-containing phosphohydrolase [Bacteroidales bacterium]